MKVGFAGLGRMGSAMAPRLLQAGIPLTVWNRSPERTIVLARQNALVASSPTDLTSAVDVVLSISKDDAAAAYSYASPALKQIFPQADIFMYMVQNSYAPVYRHKSFEFGESRADGGRIAQRVHIIDADGQAWEALYTLEQQPDGSLKITGCSLLKAGQSA